MTRYLRMFLFGCLLMAGGMVFGQNKEVLLVQQLPVGSKSPGVYIFWQGKDPEKVEMKDANPIAQTTVLALVFQRLYKEGWEVASKSAALSTGLYVLEREGK